MASKEMIEGLVIRFCEVYSKERTRSLTDSFYIVLKNYSDKQVQDAGFKCLEELEFMPKPSQVAKRIPKLDTDRHNQELRKRFTCPVCGYYSTIIVEGKCWYCHTGISKGFERNPWHWDIGDYEKKDFVIEDRIQCSKCGTIGICIKEPIKDGEWECRKCYTGISVKEIKARLHTLVELSGEGFPEGITTSKGRFEHLKLRARELASQLEGKMI